MSLMRLYFITLLFLWSANVLAQENWDGTGEIEDAQVIIEKDRRIALPPASRNYEKVPALPREKEESGSFRFKNFTYELKPLDPKIRILTIQEDPLPKLYGNYIKGGFGNYVTPYLEGFFTSKRNEKYSGGLHFKHLSSRKGPVDDENSGTSENALNLFGKYFTKPLTFSGNIGYNRQKHYFYGYTPGSEVDRDDIKQLFNAFDLGLSMKNNKADSDLRYKLGVSFNYLTDNYDARERTFGAGMEGKYRMSDVVSIKLKSDLYLSKHEDKAAVDRTLFRIAPGFLTMVGQFEVLAGINLVYENDSLDNADRLHFYPMAEAGYYLGEDIKAYAGIGGDIERKSLQYFVRENPYLAPDVSLFNTNKTFEFYGGVQGKILRNISFSTGLSIGNYKNMYYFINSAADSAKFDIVYENEGTSRVNIFGEVGFTSPENFTGLFRADFYQYGTDVLEEAWHKPQYELSLLANYSLYDKILFTANFGLLGGIKAKNFQSGSEERLDPIVDLDFKTDYLLSDRASVFLKLDNILSQQNERYLYYPSRKIMVMLGLTYAF